MVLGYSEWMNASLILCFILNTQMLHYTSLCTLCNDFSISVRSSSEKKTASESSIIFFLNLMLPDDCFCNIVEIFLKWKAKANESCVFFTFTLISLYLFLLVHLLDEILLCLGTIWSLDGDFLCKFHTSAFVESHFSEIMINNIDFKILNIIIELWYICIIHEIQKP